MAPRRTRPTSVKLSEEVKLDQKAADSSLNVDENLGSNSDPDIICGVHRCILEGFDNLINWNDNEVMTPKQYEKSNKFVIPPEDKSVSHAIKLIDSELASFCFKEYTAPPMPEQEEDVVIHLPGLKPNHQTCFPKMSVLNAREQNKLYRFYCRMNIKHYRPLNEQEFAEFKALRVKVAEEYGAFQEFAKSLWYKGQWRRALQIPPSVEMFINSLWKLRAGQCLTAYPDDYKTISPIPLTLHDPNEDFSVMEFVRNIQTQSLPVKMSLPHVKKPIELISKFEDLTRIKPVSTDVLNRPKPLIKAIYPVSFDSNVEKILEQDDLDIDVVISMSGIKTLVDNIKFQREWVLPVTVKNFLKSDGETVKKVVIIDKKLPPRTMSVHEKNIWHAKIVAKWLLVKNECPHLFDVKEETARNKAKGANESYEDMLSDVVEKLNIERFPENLETKTKQSSNSPQSPGTPLVNHNQAAGFVKPPARALKQNNLEARAKGDRELISFDDLLSNTKTKLINRKESSVKACDKNQELSGTELLNVPRPQMKNGPLCRDRWGGSNNAQARSEQKNKENRKRDRQKLITYDDPFSDGIGEDIEEFGVDPAPQTRLQTRDTTRKETARSNSSPVVTEENSPKKDTNTRIIDTRKFPLLEDGEINNIGFTRTFIKPSSTRKGMQTPCLQYQLWSLHKSKYIQFLKLEQRKLNVLVRSKSDGKMFHYQAGNKVLEDVCVSSKVEFQPEFGASKMAVSELIREYIDLYMRPGSKLVRVRSVGHTKELMMTEVKTLSDIREALQLEVRQVQKLFDPLYAVLTKLIDLNPGRYILHHSAKMGPFVALMVEKPGWMGQFNLPEYCNSMNTVEVNVPPMPIDPLVLTALQHRDKVAPALFTPLFRAQNIECSKGYFRRPQPQPPKQKKKSAKARKMKKGNECNARDLSTSV